MSHMLYGTAIIISVTNVRGDAITTKLGKPRTSLNYLHMTFTLSIIIIIYFLFEIT